MPTTAPLPHGLRLSPSSRSVFKTLSRLSRASLISLALGWLEESNLALCMPYVVGDVEDEDDEDGTAPYGAAQSVEELREVYAELQARKGTKREIVDRIVEGDWRNGISMYQLAMAETRYLLDHASAQRWNALRLTRAGTKDDWTHSIGDDGNDMSHLPRFHAQSFLLNLQREVAPVTRAHYYLSPVKSMPITLLRVYIHDSPYNTQRSLQDVSEFKQKGSGDGSNSIFVVFPDGSPYVYVSIASNQGQASGSESRSLRKVVLDV